MSENPVIFISHASSADGTVAVALGEKLKEYLDPIEVFVTSSPEAIPAATKWFPDMLKHLEVAQALVVIVSPLSKYSQWVHFEIGYFSKVYEDRKRAGEENLDKYPIYPLTIADEPIFDTIKDAQGKSLDQSQSLQQFFKDITSDFERGGPTEFDVEDIVVLCDIHNYSDLLTSQSSVLKPKDYSDDEIRDKLREYLDNEYAAFTDPIQRALRPVLKRQKGIFEGKSIEYEILDRKLDFHSGKSRLFLLRVASKYGLIPELNGEHRIQFRYEASQDKHL